MKKKVFKVVVFAGCFLFIWWIASKIVNKSLFLPSPIETFSMIAELFKTGTFFKNLGSSFLRVTAGIVIAALISIPLGMGIAWFKPVSSIFKPVVDSFKYIPPTSFQPMLVLMLGIGEEMKVIFIAIAALFSFLPTVIQTCSEPIDKLKETAYTMGFSYKRMLVHCFIPYIMPSMLQSFITLYSVGWTYVILAESSNTKFGLGHLMYIGSARGRTATVFAAIVIVAVAGFAIDKLANKLVRHAFKWRFIDEK